jgi:hypothetical protein
MNDYIAHLETDLLEAAGRLYPGQEPAPMLRRVRRSMRAHPLLATGLVALGVAAPLAAADATGVIELGGGISATSVSSLPEWNGKTGTFVTGGNGDPYIYHLTGGSAPNLSCGPTDPNPTNNIYVTSTLPLASAELEEILDEEISHETASSQAVTNEIAEGKSPSGVTEMTKGRHPVISGSGPATGRKLPEGVTSISNGCPTPGVAGQPGNPGSPAAPGKTGVTVAPSDTGASTAP